MRRKTGASLLLAWLIIGAGQRASWADDAVTLRLRLTAGQVLRYEAKHVIDMESTVSGSTQTFKSETSSIREWKVLEVEPSGAARLELTILEVRVDAKTPDGKKFAFDTKKEPNHPLAGMVGKPMVELKLSPSAQILDLRDKGGPAASQFAGHVRALVYGFPTTPIRPGATWQQDIDLPLPQPSGEADEVRVRQTLRLEKVGDATATINLRTAPAEEIKDKTILERLAQFLPSGWIEVDLSSGIVRSQELALDQTVTDFAGPDSTMHVTGSYHERLINEVARNESR
jgi:hypothetical protein